MPTHNVTQVKVSGTTGDGRQGVDAVAVRLQAGDERALEQLFELYVPRLYRFIHRSLGDGETVEVEDLLQETMVAALRSLHRYRGDSALYTWLCAIARHKVQDHIRQRQRSRRRMSPSPLDELGELATSSRSSFEGAFVQQQVVEQALRELPPDYRTVLVGKYMEGLSVAELAQVMARSEKSVESLLTRARAAMRDRLAGTRSE